MKKYHTLVKWEVKKTNLEIQILKLSRKLKRMQYMYQLQDSAVCIRALCLQFFDHHCRKH